MSNILNVCKKKFFVFPRFRRGSKVVWGKGYVAVRWDTTGVKEENKYPTYQGKYAMSPSEFLMEKLAGTAITEEEMQEHVDGNREY